MIFIMYYYIIITYLKILFLLLYKYERKERRGSMIIILQHPACLCPCLGADGSHNTKTRFCIGSLQSKKIDSHAYDLSFGWKGVARGAIYTRHFSATGTNSLLRCAIAGLVPTKGLCLLVLWKTFPSTMSSGDL